MRLALVFHRAGGGQRGVAKVAYIGERSAGSAQVGEANAMICGRRCGGFHDAVSS